MIRQSRAARMLLGAAALSAAFLSPAMAFEAKLRYDPVDGGGLWSVAQFGSLTEPVQIDTGASRTAITDSIALQLLENGEAEVMREGKNVMADGSEHTSFELRIFNVQFGNRAFHNIHAITVPDSGTCLWGLPQLGAHFTIDLHKNTLTF